MQMAKDVHTAFLVDDSEDDRFFMRKALEWNPHLIVIGEACDGQEVMDYLSGTAAFGDRQTHPFPDILLLDLKMPRKNGYDVLQWLKTQSFQNLTVVVVSGSWLAEDVAKSMALGAHGYFKKTVVKKEQKEMAEEIEHLLIKRGHHS
jgi:CheY-like chemotaxis protein